MDVTIYDVAKAANVSMATVSRVMNGNPNVKPETRQRVQDVIKELNYRPNAVARGLASKKTTTIGVVIPDISDTYYSELTRGIEDVAKMYQYNIILTNSDKKLDKELELINDMSSKQVDGLLFMGDELTQAHRTYFEGLKVPVVLAGLLDGKNEIPSVNIDYGQATYDSMKHLLKAGHRKIGLIMGNMRQLILKKYIIPSAEKALSEYQAEFMSHYLYEGDNSYKSGLEATAVFLNMSPATRPTAIFVLNDEMALGVIHGIQDHGLNVPNDFEVLSFEDTKLTRMVRPTLSSVVQPMYDIGAVSMRLLTKLMRKEEIAETQILLPHRIEFRGSTK